MVVNETSGDPIALSEVERYIIPQAKITTIKPDKSPVEKELKLRACDWIDTTYMIFEPAGNDWSRENLTDIADSMLCLDDPNVISLNGHYLKGDGTFLSITWTECETNESVPYVIGTEKCKSEDDIKRFK